MGYHTAKKNMDASLLTAPLIALAAYFVRGVAGFGSALVASPLLAQFYPLTLVVPLVVELDQSPREIVAAGFPEAVVRKVVRLIDASEYKRRQSAPGIRVTKRGFGKDRRYPVTNRYRAPF